MIYSIHYSTVTQNLLSTLSSNLGLTMLSRSSDPPISTGKRNIAIAEIVIYSLVHIAQFSIRCLQEWRYWHHNKNKSIGRCVFYSWWSMVGLLSQSKWKTFRQFGRYGHWNPSQFAYRARLWCFPAHTRISQCSLLNPYCKAWVFRPSCLRSAWSYCDGMLRTPLVLWCHPGGCLVFQVSRPLFAS